VPGETSHRGYQTVNILFAVLILIVFLYSLLYPPSGGHPVPSVYTLLSGDPSPTAGLSRSFSALIRGEWTLARELSPYGILLFLFLLIQLVMRVTAFLILKKRSFPQRMILKMDIILSVSLFLLCYGRLVYVMLEG
jgi:heme/copper-type cytochrome/quinol oxidase subunit 4